MLLQSVKEYLEKNGTNEVHTKSKDGMLPLAVAAFWGYAEIVQLLLENGLVNHLYISMQYMSIFSYMSGYSTRVLNIVLTIYLTIYTFCTE